MIDHHQQTMRGTAAVMPDGKGGLTPCPGFLTVEVAIRFLCLDENGPNR